MPRNRINYNKNKEHSVLLKILVCGDCKVGKSLFCQQLSNNNSNRELNNVLLKNYEPTVGLDMIVIKRKIKNLNVKIHFWDTSGQDRYRGIIKSYYRACCAAIIIIDLNDENAEYSVKDWIKDLKSQMRMDNKKLIISVFANKANGINPINLIKNNKKHDNQNIIKQICDKENVIYNEIKLSIDFTINDNEYFVDEQNYITLTTALDNLINTINDLYLSNNMNINILDNQKVHGICYGFDDDKTKSKKNINDYPITDDINRPLLKGEQKTMLLTQNHNCCCIIQ